MFGFNVKATLAGLGIGGLAIALAAQKTLENVIGGVSLLMDKAVQVGDLGDQIGTVEDIGLRSLRLRTIDQNRYVLHRVQFMLDEHHGIETGTSRVRVAHFAGAAFELHLFAYSKTADCVEFTAIRQDVILKIAEIVEAAGTRFAGPTQVTYLSSDVGVDAEKALKEGWTCR